MDDERFDGLYLNVANTTRGIEPLLDTVFSFLRRKTDFFAGPPGSANGTEAAIQKVNDVLEKHAQIYRQAEQAKQKKAAAAPKKKKKAPAKMTPKKEEEDVLEVGTDGGFDASPTTKQEEKPAAAAAPKKKEEAPSPAQKDEPPPTSAADDDDDTKKPPPPLGNGGTVDGKYVWSQTLSEVTVNIPLPDNTRGRDLNVTMGKKKLQVGLKAAAAGEWMMNGALPKTIILDDSFWTVEDGNRLVMNLQKLNQAEWWDCILVGDPTIDVKTIQPENSNISDLDGEMQQTVEKMMFDNRQKAMGLPTSDEQKKYEMLEKFKKSHPEMDFSNAKIN